MPCSNRYSSVGTSIRKNAAPLNASATTGSTSVARRGTATKRITATSTIRINVKIAK